MTRMDSCYETARTCQACGGETRSEEECLPGLCDLCRRLVEEKRLRSGGPPPDPNEDLSLQWPKTGN